MTIKVWDYLAELEEEKQEIFEGIEKVLRSGRLILGESVKKFEEEFSNYCQMPYGVGVDNATNGLFLALKALEVGSGDEVITVSNTAVPTVCAIASTGAKPVFVDINPATYLMDVNKLRDAINERTKCLMPVHLFGQCVDMDPLIAIAKENNLPIVEDASQSHGAEYKGRRAGSMSELSVFSFYPTKPLGGFGDGGMILTNSEKHLAKLRRLRFYGMEAVYYAEEHGYNSRLDELHAEILMRKLVRLEGKIEKRRKLARRYNEILGSTALKLPVESEHNRHVYYLYVVAHPDRERIMKELGNNDILVNISYPWPIHTMRGYSYLKYKEGDLPHTEAAAKEIFSLPFYPNLTFDEQDKVCRVLAKILGEKINL